MVLRRGGALSNNCLWLVVSIQFHSLINILLVTLFPHVVLMIIISVSTHSAITLNNSSLIIFFYFFEVAFPHIVFIFI